MRLRMKFIGNSEILIQMWDCHISHRADNVKTYAGEHKFAFNHYFRFVVGARPMWVKCPVPHREQPAAISGASGRNKKEREKRKEKRSMHD